MLPVEHTLYAHLCFLRVAARRTNARRSEPERTERVRSWQDRSGNGIHAVPLDGLNGTYDGNTPHFIAKATINGLPALSFGKQDSLKAARGCRVRTIAIVAQHRTVSHCMMLFSHYKNKDFSLRVESAHGYRRAGSTTGGRRLAQCLR